MSITVALTADLNQIHKHKCQIRQKRRLELVIQLLHFFRPRKKEQVTSELGAQTKCSFPSNKRAEKEE